MKHLDLFSGIGGFALAAKWAGIETVQFVEIDKFCQQVLAKNFPNVPIHNDIKTFKFDDEIYLLTGGFPCQPFSCAGKRKGFQDDRYLWPEMLRVIKETNPRWIIAENVPGIISHIDTVLDDLEREGYTTETYLIPAVAVGAPHKRERVWIIANRHGKRCNDRSDNRQERHVQDDWQQHIAKIQSEWPQFKPESWATFNTQEWLGFTTDSNLDQCDKRTKNNEAISERSKWEKSTSKDRDVISNTNCITSSQTDSRSITERESGKTWRVNSVEHRQNESIFNWEENKPPVPGVDDGVPNGLDRNKALGNAIVPQIPYIFISMIKKIDMNFNAS